MAVIKYTTKCAKCGGVAAKGTGSIRKGANGKWVATCSPCGVKRAQEAATFDARGMPYLPEYPIRPAPPVPVDRVKMVSWDGEVAYFAPDDVYDAQKDGYRRA